MYIDIDPNANLDEACMATFKETGASAPVRAVRLLRDAGWEWCAITGWSAGAPAPALLTPIEESGDGPALLLHGGNHGLRLAPISVPAAAGAVRWDVTDASQWSEPFLLCRPGTETV
jgi:hypothetical protein